MSILKILQYPDLRLYRKSHEVTDLKSPKIQKIIMDMTETLVKVKNCAGLAATQLDIKDPPSITVINLPVNNHGASELLCLVNPQIVKKEGSSFAEEGCMSIYPQEIHVKLKRAAKVQVKAVDRYGEKLEFEATDFFARCIQHECDHLAGILYLDRLSKLNRSRIDKKIAKMAHRLVVN